MVNSVVYIFIGVYVVPVILHILILVSDHLFSKHPVHWDYLTYFKKALIPFFNIVMLVNILRMFIIDGIVGLVRLIKNHRNKTQEVDSKYEYVTDCDGANMYPSNISNKD